MPDRALQGRARGPPLRTGLHGPHAHAPARPRLPERLNDAREGVARRAEAPAQHLARSGSVRATQLLARRRMTAPAGEVAAAASAPPAASTPPSASTPPASTPTSVS